MINKTLFLNVFLYFEIRLMMFFIKNKYFQNLGLIIFFIGMECFRAPDILKYGRFWEDESALFQYAWSHSFIETVCYVYGGYLNLAANISIWAAKTLVPLEYAPYVTTGTGLLFFILPLFLLLTAQDKWLQQFRTRLFATLLILLVPEHMELSLESLHIQFWLIFSTLIIILLESTPYQRYLKDGILLLCALSSMIAILLIPILGIRYLMDRNRFRLEQLCLLMIGGFIQFFICYNPYQARSFHFSFVDYLTVFFTRNFISPFIGVNIYSFAYLESIYNLRENSLIPIIPCIGAILFFIFMIYCIYKYPKIRIDIGILLLALIEMQFISIYGAIGPVNWFYHLSWNQRYVFLTQIIIVLILLYLSANLPIKGQYFCYVVILWISCVGVFNFYEIKQTAPFALTWKQQVTLWRSNPNVSFVAWPGHNVWMFKLVKKLQYNSK